MTGETKQALDAFLPPGESWDARLERMMFESIGDGSRESSGTLSVEDVRDAAYRGAKQALEEMNAR